MPPAVKVHPSMFQENRSHSLPVAAACLIPLLVVAFWFLTSSPELATRLGLVSLAGLLILVLPIHYSILLPFCSIIWLGGGFRYGAVLPVSPHAMCIALVVVARLIRPQPANLLSAVLRNGPLAVYCFLIGLAFLFGLASGADLTTIKEDAVSFVYFVVMYAMAASTRGLNVRTVIRGLTIITCLAIFKILYLYAVPVGATWTNDWQASVVVGGSPLDTRIILNGADVFFVLCLAFIFSALLVTPSLFMKVGTLLPMVLLGVGIFFAATRSNWIGLGAAMVVQLVIATRRALISRATRTRVLVALLLTAGVIFATSVKQEYSFAEKVQLRFQDPNRETSINFRIDESRALVESVGWNFAFGRGLGSQYTSILGQGSWSHNGFLFLYLKMGLAGLSIYLLLISRGFKTLWYAFMSSRNAPDLALYLGFLGSLVSLSVLSLTVNKNFDVSGALFSGLLLGIYCPLAQRKVMEQPAGTSQLGRALRNQALGRRFPSAVS